MDAPLPQVALVRSSSSLSTMFSAGSADPAEDTVPDQMIGAGAPAGALTDVDSIVEMLSDQRLIDCE